MTEENQNNGERNSGVGRKNSAFSQELCERILDGWLRMSTAISNERLVSAMTYNESMVCGALHQVQGDGALPLTATQLCRRLQILKPQMNVILNGLEKRGLIRRERSSKDHRQIHILLTKEGECVYTTAHQELLALPQGLINRLGVEKMSMFAELMCTVAENFQEMQKEKNDTACFPGDAPNVKLPENEVRSNYYEKRDLDTDKQHRT